MLLNAFQSKKGKHICEEMPDKVFIGGSIFAYVYTLFTANSKTEKRLQKYLAMRQDIREKLKRLKQEPRRANDAHQLHGRLAGKWSCWLGSNIRIIYSVDDANRKVIIEAVGSHAIY